MSQGVETKEFLKPPFSAYDFFGYLIPAFLFLICVFLFELPAKQFIPKYHQPLHSLVERTVPSKEASFFFQAAFGLGAILAVYVCGHVIGTFSSVLLDRTLVSKAHGYPWVHLVHTRESTSRIDAAQSFYRGFFAWSNIFGWALFLWAVFGERNVPRWIYWTVGFLTLGPVLVYLILTYFWPTPKEATKKRPHLSWKWYVHPFNRMLLFVNTHRIAIRRLLKVYAMPYDFGWWLLTRFFRWNEPFSTELREKYQQAFSKTFGMKSPAAGTDNYWLSTFYVAERSPVVYQMLRNWFHLYSFARNVAMAFYLSFCYGAIYIAAVRINGAVIPHGAEMCFVGTLIAYFTLAALLTIRYYYLFFSYYSKNLFRAFVYATVVSSSVEGTASEQEVVQ